MGKSTTISCFNIIACGSDSSEKSDLEQQTENKSSMDKRGWSFSKRSGRHRVLSNSVISELPSAGNKDSLDTVSNDIHAQTNITVPDKISIVDETPQFTPTKVNSDFTDSADALLVTGNDRGFNCNLQESVAIVIQAAIRGYLARRVFFKHKSAVKLQAAVRGHLIRRQAVGTLRCVQAIVKLQALVRARRVRLSAEGLGIQEKLGEKIKTNNQRVNPLGKKNSGDEAKKAYSSSQKLLTNGFARQLLESTPKTQRINIICDPSKPDLAWRWLERWMSVSSSDIAQLPKPNIELDSQDQGDAKLAASKVGTDVQIEVISRSADLKSDIRQEKILLEGEENLVENGPDDFEFQSCKPTEVLGKSSGSLMAGGIKQPLGKSSSSAIEDDTEQPQLAVSGLKQEVSADIRTVLNEAPASSSNQMEIQSDVTLLPVLDSVSDKVEADRENSKRTTKRVASEQLETEGKKFVSRKSTNPAFAAMQSKFEELSSAATSGRSISSTYCEVAVESKLDSHSSQINSMSKAKDLSLTEDSASHDPKVQIGGSECGTELSISSAFQSAEISEVEGGGLSHEIGTTYKGVSYPIGTDDKISYHGNLDAEGEQPSSMLETLPAPSNPGFVCSTKVDENKNASDSIADVVSNKGEQQQQLRLSESIMSDMYNDTITDQAVDSLSQGESPRSHITAPESSQVSVNVKGNKSDNSMPTQKRKPQSVGKRSPSHQNNDSAARSSTEHLPKDPKNGKRRNSFDQELRVSSSNSLPSYMQATESARAKAQTNNSPKSSPDVQDKDIYIKKRYSLPVTNEKQGSPRVQQSMSQAQQSAKGNGTHSPQNAVERKWLR